MRLVCCGIPLRMLWLRFREMNKQSPFTLIKGSETHCRFRSLLVAPHWVCIKMTIAMQVAQIASWDTQHRKGMEFLTMKIDTVIFHFLTVFPVNVSVSGWSNKTLGHCQVTCPLEVQSWRLSYGDCVNLLNTVCPVMAWFWESPNGICRRRGLLRVLSDLAFK